MAKKQAGTAMHPGLPPPSSLYLTEIAVRYVLAGEENCTKLSLYANIDRISWCSAFTSFSSALLAMKGMMVQEGMTMDEALTVMEEGQKLPGRPAPKLSPRILGGICHNQDETA